MQKRLQSRFREFMFVSALCAATIIVPLFSFMGSAHAQDTIDYNETGARDSTTNLTNSHIPPNTNGTTVRAIELGGRTGDFTMSGAKIQLVNTCTTSCAQKKVGISIFYGTTLSGSSLLATSNTQVAVTSISTSATGSFVQFNFSSTVNLDHLINYYIVLMGSGAATFPNGDGVDLNVWNTNNNARVWSYSYNSNPSLGTATPVGGGTPRYAKVQLLGANSTFLHPGTDFSITTSTPFYPDDSLRFKYHWFDTFYYPDQLKYAYFFPYGKPSRPADHIQHNYCGGDTTCPSVKITLVNGEAQPDGLAGSGAIYFNYAYPSPGSFTGSIITSTECNLDQLLSDIYDDCNSDVQNVHVTVLDNKYTSATDIGSVGHSWVVGGGSSTGSYLAADKKIAEIGEPVNLRWHYNMGAFTVSQVKLFSGSGSNPIRSFSGALDISQDTNHYATLWYKYAGQYQPHLRVCVGDCSTTFMDIYLGGKSYADNDQAITIVTSTYQGSFTSSGSLAGGSCATTGAFGLTPDTFKISFGTGSNVLVQGVVQTSNRAIDAFFWLGSNLFCVISKAPLLSTIHNIVAPAPGTYDLPLTWFGKTYTAEELYGSDEDASFTVVYNSTDGAEEIWSIVTKMILALAVTMFVIKHLFRHHG